MSNNVKVFLATIGHGIWRSKNGGVNWETYMGDGKNFNVHCDVRALLVHPDDPRVLYAGTNDGLFRTEDCGENWIRLESGMDDRQIWSIAILPENPKIILAGTWPGELFRSTDGGNSWECLNVGMAEQCDYMYHPRVTTLMADPDSPSTVWAGVEIDGMYRSDDCGATWRHLTKGISSPDIHSMGIIPENGHDKKVLVICNNDLNIFNEERENWVPQNLTQKLKFGYIRGLKQKPGRPEVLFLGSGDGPPGSAGQAYRSEDGGKNWEELSFPVEPFSTVWDFAVHPADPDRIYSYTNFGELFLSKNGGDSWTKLPRTFGELRNMVWTPG